MASHRTDLRNRHGRPAAPSLTRLAAVLGPALLATAVLAACRQQPTPQPLPDPMTPDSFQTLAGSHIP